MNGDKQRVEQKIVIINRNIFVRINIHKYYHLLLLTNTSTHF